MRSSFGRFGAEGSVIDVSGASRSVTSAPWLGRLQLFGPRRLPRRAELEVSHQNVGRDVARDDLFALPTRASALCVCRQSRALTEYLPSETPPRR